jgi:hypothetical protein
VQLSGLSLRRRYTPRFASMSSRSAIVLLVGACLSCATPYQPKGFRGGYTDFEPQSGIYFVSFRGNGFTSRDTVIRYWHQRCSEICDGRDAYEIVSYDPATTQHISGTDGQINTVHKSSVEGYIRCRKPVAPIDP